MDAGGRMFQDFIALWKTLPKSVGNVPAKACFSPTLAPALVPNLFVAEHMARYKLEVRLLGTDIEARPSFRVSGENLFDRLHEDEWDHFEAFLQAYRQHPCAARVKRRVTGDGGRIYDLHTLGAPLADASGEVRYILGVGYIEANTAESMEASEKRKNSARPYREERIPPTIREAAFVDLGFGLPACTLEHFNHNR